MTPENEPQFPKVVVESDVPIESCVHKYVCAARFGYFQVAYDFRLCVFFPSLRLRGVAAYFLIELSQSIVVQSVCGKAKAARNGLCLDSFYWSVTS